MRMRMRRVASSWADGYACGPHFILPSRPPLGEEVLIKRKAFVGLSVILTTLLMTASQLSTNGTGVYDSFGYGRSKRGARRVQCASASCYTGAGSCTSGDSTPIGPHVDTQPVK